MTFRKMTIAFINLIDILEVFDRIFLLVTKFFCFIAANSDFRRWN